MSEARYSIGPGGDSITCTKCRRTSHSVNDVANRYCGFCHEFMDDARRDAPTLTPGQHVRVRVAGSDNEWTYGIVSLSSHNGASIGIRLERVMATPFGAVGGTLLLMIDDAAGTATGALDGNEYEVQTRVTGPPLEVQ